MARVYWRPDEIEKMARRMIELKINPDSKGFYVELRAQQKEVLPPTRWRELNGNDQAHDVIDAVRRLQYVVNLEQEVARLTVLQGELQAMKEPVLQTVKDFSFDEIVRGLIEKAAAAAVAGVQQEVTRMVADAIVKVQPVPASDNYEFPSAHQISVPVPPVVVKPHQPRIVVVGLLNAQANEIETTFLDFAQFRFVKSQGGPGMVDKAQQWADVVVTMTRFVSHDVESHAKKLNCPFIRLNGNVSALKKWVRQYLNEGLVLKSFSELKNGKA